MDEHVGPMQAIVEDLLMLSKLEQNDKADDQVTVSVPELIADIQRQSQNIAPHLDHMLALEIDTNLEIFGSSKELYSCFSNLVFNAIHYTDDRGVIEIRWYRDELGAHFSVKDAGSGIAAEHIPRLTARFYRVDHSRTKARGGTGLGLAIVKHVLTRHGATMHIESEIDVGSTFHCDFPFYAIVEAEPNDTKDKSA